MEFIYQASDLAGNIEQGRETADSREQLLLKLRAQGKFPLEVRPVTGLSLSFKGKGLPRQELLNFTQQLAGLLKAGISLERGLTIISRLKFQGELGQIVAELRRCLQEGMSFTAALERYPETFPPLYINMVRAGEAGGILAPVLERLASYQEDEINLRRFVTSSLFYPGIVVTASIGALLFYITVVVPKFETIFRDMGQDLPLITRLVMGLGTLLTRGWPVLLVAIAVVVGWYWKEKASPAGQFRIDRFKLSIPWVGPVLQRIATARMALALGLLNSSGISLLTGLRITAAIVGNKVMEKALLEVEQEVRQGHTLSNSMATRPVFPDLAVEMIGVGEESGNLSPMLEQVAKTYDGQVKHGLSIFMALFEPLLIVIMVGVIAVLAVAILLPIINMNSSITTR
ncbi:MAG TPA: type II secretion system F family protein [Bacillota bacterium]|nr:type II secretion system F family protein [Bacillota bacterium]